MKNKTEQAVLVLCVRTSPCTGKKEVLLGLRKSGLIARHVVAIGGHIKPDDYGPISAGHREAKEESSLVLDYSRIVAKLQIYIKGEALKLAVYVTISSMWSGRLKNKSEEFEWLRFIPFEEIPWDKFPLGDEDWMKKVLLEGKCCTVTIRCGKDRNDFESVSVRTCNGFSRPK